MRPFVLITAVVLILVGPVVAWVVLHNDLVDREERVLKDWAQVQSNFQRRADLIPRLVESLSRYLQHERETLAAVTAQRSAALPPLETALRELDTTRQEAGAVMEGHATQVPATDAELAAINAAQARVHNGLMRVIALAENYPNLQASDQFLTLQAQLEGTENRINVARMRFNEAVQDYNRALRTLPSSLVARVEGLQRKAYFQADSGSAQARELGFDD